MRILELRASLRWLRGLAFGAVVLVGGCRNDAPAAPRHEPGGPLAVVTDPPPDYDPIYSAIRFIAGDCPQIANVLDGMYDSGKINYVPSLETPGADGETTWNKNPVTGERQPGSERIWLGDWMGARDPEIIADLLRHEYGHVVGMDRHLPDGTTGYEMYCPFQ